MANKLETPAIWYPGQSQLEYEEEINLMLQRAQITAAFLRGEIYPDTFLDFLDEEEFDVFELADDWEFGV
ncbi:hypothetical protein [Nostoc sp. DedQUE04]|uniref:hypothetical protein n=1 Tax=Nostoc sp. DedQUE04 TaxID=3075390 RepID=UPI002AD1D6D3|nr:hypothetical protein [Nostoc sp. DedQUE04]